MTPEKCDTPVYVELTPKYVKILGLLGKNTPEERVDFIQRSLGEKALKAVKFRAELGIPFSQEELDFLQEEFGISEKTIKEYRNGRDQKRQM